MADTKNLKTTQTEETQEIQETQEAQDEQVREAVMERERYRLIADVKYDDNGTIKTGTVTIGPNNATMDDASSDSYESVIQKYQKVTTDTITGYRVEFTQYFTGQFGTPGSYDENWEELSDVKLVNNYTDGEKDYKETIKRPATSATAADLKAYATGLTSLYDDMGGLTAVNGYFTGSSVESAWQNS